jgi:glycine N-methyltransferase
MVDNIYRTRSLGTAAEGLRDQYADGKAARVWEVYIGDKSSRTENYRNFITSLLKEKKCHTVLDLACGTGYHLIYILFMQASVLADYTSEN